MAAPTDFITIKAMVNYNAREAAKSRGFAWDPDEKQWVKSIRPMDLFFERRAPFNLKVLETNEVFPPLPGY